MAEENVFASTSEEANVPAAAKPPNSGADELLKDAVSRGDAALGRTETKTSILLAVFSPILAVGLAVLPRSTVPLVTTIALWAALGLLAAALLTLLWNVLPRLGGSGFITYSAMNDDELARHFALAAESPQEWRRASLHAVVRLGKKKFRLLRVATVLIMAAIPCALVAAIAATG